MSSFQVTVETDDFDEKMFSISVTHNGYGWSTIRVTKEQLVIVAREILKAYTQEES